MDELLDYLDELMLLSPELESEISEKAVIWADLTEGDILQGETIKNYVFFIKEGIISNNFVIGEEECIFHLFGKSSFLFQDSFIYHGLTGTFQNIIKAYKSCKLIAISLQDFEELMQLYPDIDEVYYIAMRQMLNFQSKYLWNVPRRNSYQLLKSFSMDFPYLYKYTNPAELEEILSLPPGLMPRLC